MAVREKHVRLLFDGDVKIDVKQVMSGRKVKEFAINLAVIVGSKPQDVFRVDTAHGYLHVQKFWISDKPEILQAKKKKDYVGDFGYWKDEVTKNYRSYVDQWKKKKIKVIENEKQEKGKGNGH
jgi:hypothetical protein